jgi:predicted amidophosphoribosyltransferase
VAAESLFATLFPSDCRLCGAALTEVSRLPVCSACVGSIRRIAAKTCAVCGELVPGAQAGGDQDEVRCGLCQRARLPFAKAVAYGNYDGALRGLVHLLKYDGVRPAADVLGRMLAEATAGLKLAAAEKAPLMIPVPLSVGRERQRGFNQAEEIARAALWQWAKPGERGAASSVAAGGTPALPELNTSALKRVRETQSQTGLTRHQRRANLRGAFVAARPEQIAGREIILVDDVYTTGTTAYECARVLRRAGAAEVYVATAARVLKGEGQTAKTAGEGARATQVDSKAAGEGPSTSFRAGSRATQVDPEAAVRARA